MIRDCFLIESSSLNPYFNLALETLLLDHLQKHQCILYLWQTENTIVIGKNQNAWKECEVERFHQAAGKIARRSSGGGAVYHDLGNLNFTFVTNEEDYNVHRQLTVIQNALEELGIHAEISGRNDLMVEDKKISGNAFLKKAGRCYHHGTLLVTADKSKMTEFLKPSKYKLASKGVDSVRSRTANLIEFNPLITIDVLKSALITAFKKEYGMVKSLFISEAMKEEIELLALKYASDMWNLNVREQSGVKIEQRFDWGEIQMNLQIEEERIQTVTLFTDAMDAELFEGVSQWLKGCPLNELKGRIEQFAKKAQWEEKIKQDFLTCFEKEEIHGTL